MSKIGHVFSFFVTLMLAIPDGIAASESLIYSPNIQENQAFQMEDSSYAIFNHSNDTFDQGLVTYDGVRRLVEFSQNQGIHRLGVISFPPSSLRQHYRPEEVDTILSSSAGQHQLIFSNAKTLYLAGGILSHCLCEFMRDAIRGRASIPWQPLDLVLVSDAIYIDYSRWPWSLEDRPNFKAEYQRVEQIYPGNDEIIRTIVGAYAFTLSDFLAVAKKKGMLKVVRDYISKNVIGENGSMCRGNANGSPVLDGQKFGFDLYFDDELIQSFQENQPRRIRLLVRESSQLR